jgi:hypothetical protein
VTRTRTIFLSIAKAAALLAPALGSAISLYAKSSAETAAGYRALKDSVERQGETTSRHDVEIRELRAALLSHSVCPPASVASLPAKLPLIGLGKLGAIGSGAGAKAEPAPAPSALRPLRPLPKNPGEARELGF